MAWAGGDITPRRATFIKHVLWALAAIMAAGVPLAWSSGQQPESDSGSHAAGVAGSEESECRGCHTCNQPTPERRCLPLCTRHRMHTHKARGPDIVIMDELESAYMPVPFDHKGHAAMAEMTQGCATCHHRTPIGEQPPACKTCHDASAAGTDMHKPGLRGAYHQQCLNCHRQWMNERDCDACHPSKDGVPARSAQEEELTKDDILLRMHPPIPEPDTDIYQGRNVRKTDTKVLFRHGQHAHRFGLKCVECHHERSCTRCHRKEGETQRRRTLVEHHRPCVQCHKSDMDLAGRQAGRCATCHWREGTPKPEPFDHSDTGWPLKTYHQRISCRACHTSVPFTPLNRDCSTCHEDWGAETFDHRVTGQALDENHADQDCESCHIDRRFDQTPSCNECHDEEDDGISFPAKRPGPVVKPAAGAISDTRGSEVRTARSCEYTSELPAPHVISRLESRLIPR
jgi:hypothetical protein